jgi:alpha-glucosidase (family GH31 glycosyl hydrolase)
MLQTLELSLVAAHTMLCCRWGYANISVLEEVVANYTAVDLPLEVVWSDIEYMSTRFWTMEFDERKQLLL